MKQIGSFDVSEQLQRLSAVGDPLEEPGRVIDFEVFRPVLDDALGHSDGARGGRPPHDAVAMFKVPILAAQDDVGDERMEFLIRDRPSWLRFPGLGPGNPAPDETAIRTFRERLMDGGAIRTLLAELDRQLREAGHLPMGGQIVDATVASAPRQRNTEARKTAIRAGRSAGETWPDSPNKAAQKDVDARWTVKFSKARPKADGARQVDIAIATFGCRNHVAIDRRFGFIRPFAVGDAARHDGQVLRAIVTRDKAALEAWADAACRSRANEAFPARHGRVSRIHFKKPGGKPMPNDIQRGNAVRSKVRARVEHVPGEHKSRMGLLVRTIGINRAEARITLVNLACNMKRLVFHERRAFTGWLCLKAATARQLAPCDAQATRKGDRQTPIRQQPAHVSRKTPVDRGVQVQGLPPARRFRWRS